MTRQTEVMEWKCVSCALHSSPMNFKQLAEPDHHTSSEFAGWIGDQENNRLYSWVPCASAVNNGMSLTTLVFFKA